VLHHPLLTDALIGDVHILDDPERLGRLDALIDRVRTHPALYAYKIVDEPGVEKFSGLARIVAYLRQRDPKHLAYVNVVPGLAASPDYRGTVQPSLLSYDFYQFRATAEGEPYDDPNYFVALRQVHDAAVSSQLPFLNIVQACRYRDNPTIQLYYDTREPTPNEMRYLVYTTLAYGGQGISYFLYTCPDCGCEYDPPRCYDCTGGIAGADGTPTSLYSALQILNREFVRIATAVQGLTSVGVYHAGFIPNSGEGLPAGAAFRFDPEIAPSAWQRDGVLLGCFGPNGGGATTTTHALVVNIDYGSERTVGVRGPGPLWVYNASDGKWIGGTSDRVQLRLPPGGGFLVSSRILLYVNGQHVGCEDGSYTCPFRTIGAAYRAAGGGETLSIAAGSYGERLRMTKAVRLVSRSGTARLGLP
jgi:hypothetical protein